MPVLTILAVAVGAWWVHAGWRKPAIIVQALPPQAGELPRVLVFTRTLGYRHRSIPAGVKAVQRMGEGLWRTEHTEDPEWFTPERLADCRVVVFLSTTGNVLRPDGQQALQAYVEGGGGWVGVHAAADTEYEWPWYGELVGAWFRDHTDVIEADVRVEDREALGVRGLPDPWRRRDEWYAFRTNPRPRTLVMASLDDSAMGTASMGGDHPIAWRHAVSRGRAWYTGMGHTIESFQEPEFLEHLRQGIEWAGRLAGAP